MWPELAGFARCHVRTRKPASPGQIGSPTFERLEKCSWQVAVGYMAPLVPAKSIFSHRSNVGRPIWPRLAVTLSPQSSVRRGRATIYSFEDQGMSRVSFEDQGMSLLSFDAFAAQGMSPDIVARIVCSLLPAPSSAFVGGDARSG